MCAGRRLRSLLRDKGRKKKNPSVDVGNLWDLNSHFDLAVFMMWTMVFNSAMILVPAEVPNPTAAEQNSDFWENFTSCRLLLCDIKITAFLPSLVLTWCHLIWSHQHVGTFSRPTGETDNVKFPQNCSHVLVQLTEGGYKGPLWHHRYLEITGALSNGILRFFYFFFAFYARVSTFSIIPDIPLFMFSFLESFSVPLAH